MEYTKIKTYEDACKIEKLNPKALPVVSMLPKAERDAIVAHYKLTVVVRAINRVQNNGKQWKPNWNDSNEYKYYPWFSVKASKTKPSGSGLAYDNFSCGSTGTDLGARLVFKTWESGKYTAENKCFNKLYTTYMLLK